MQLAHSCVMEETLSDALKRVRTAKGQTQEEARIEMGTSQANFQRWEAGLVIPEEPEFHDMLMAYLGCDFNELAALILRGQQRRKADRRRQE